MQYNACFVITATFNGTLREHLYYEVELKSLKDRR